MKVWIGFILSLSLVLVSSQQKLGRKASLICDDGTSASCTCTTPPCKPGGNRPTCICADGSTPRVKPPCADGTFPLCPEACKDGSDAVLNGNFEEPPCADRSKPNFKQCKCEDGTVIHHKGVKKHKEVKVETDDDDNDDD
ncbi:uncharacterized protein LOC111697637 isoform X2 [Eurytemora carolleeae]|uniref:uncharacterized protein LOC111697637 isoform X2 n=1 Tax=Eurytemora carolleeae TaxID=1294199 RepID=UPI000C786122|nr:uncharacterized protein LOC111697637 isoform X2 [Eurytemora carolleeae]XP_023323493.1 uncharacterized protein LOC111697637 isoform X2 [Eurytemora carolleeae]|eukprot:XP_023323486.1 uncharacterized protein LOC111697637 isoform X2 [Eurytemora affinis]